MPELLKNPLKELWAAGKPAIGTWATLVDHPKFMRLLATAGLDFCIIEMEHTDFTLKEVGAQCLVARGAGLVPIVRPPGLGAHDMTRALDSGAMGLLLPAIDTPEQLEGVMQATKYYPRGERILNSRGSHTDYHKLGSTAEQIAHLNDHTVMVAMVESQTSLDALPEICLVDGLDAVMIGPDDLSQALGVPGELSHPKMAAAKERVIEVCGDAGVPWGFSCQTIDDGKQWIDRGLQWLPFANDAAVLFNQFSGAAGALKSHAGRAA